MQQPVVLQLLVLQLCLQWCPSEAFGIRVSSGRCNRVSRRAAGDHVNDESTHQWPTEDSFEARALLPRRVVLLPDTRADPEAVWCQGMKVPLDFS
jgi:hypothetical protein